MKRLQTLLLIALAAAIFTGSVVADEPSDKFGRGRFLRKLRDDLMGKSNQPKPAAQDPRKQPTPASRQPSAENKSGAAVGTSQMKSSPSQSRSSKYSAQASGNRAPANAGQRSPYARQNDRSSNGQQANSRQPSRQPSATANRAPASKKSKAAKTGFGMKIKSDKKENLIVTHVDPHGNAADVGIRRGDTIVETGGAKLASTEEFDEITKLLGEGDLIEIQISRNGQEKTLNLQYGTPKELPEEETADNRYSAAASRSGSSQRESSSRKSSSQTGQYDFVPKATSSRFQSVLDDSSGRGSSTRTQPRAVSSTVVQQQQTIEELQREVERLRQQQNRTQAQPANSRNSYGGPSLLGPRG